MSVRLMLFLCIPFLAVACNGDTPLVVPAPVLPGATSEGDAAIGQLPPCTVFWKSGVSGNWTDASKWSSGAVPGGTDVACLSAPGTYTVTVQGNPVVGAVKVGLNGAQATLADNGTQFTWMQLGDGLLVSTTGALSATGCGLGVRSSLIGSAMRFNGTVTTANTSCNINTGALLVQADTIVNQGTMTFGGTSSLLVKNGGLFSNSGTITVNAVVSMPTFGHATMRFEGGAVAGIGILNVVPLVRPQDRPHVIWTAGTLGLSGGNVPVARIWADTMRFASASLTGAVTLYTLDPDTTVLRGDIGSNVDVRLSGCADASFELERVNGGPTENFGAITVQDDCSLGHVYLEGPGLINRGTLTFADPQWVAPVALRLDSLINHGSLLVSNAVGYEGTGGLLRNLGDIQVMGASSILMRSGTTAVAEAGSTQSGTLTLGGGFLAGVGTVGDVFALSGVIVPGGLGSPTLGRLSMASLTLSATSGIEFEVAGPGPTSHDGLDVAGEVRFNGGAVTLVSVPPYAGGACGDVVPLIVDHSVGARGSFNTEAGYHPQPGVWWRSYYAAGEFGIAGYNPVAAVTATPTAVTVGEGGVTRSYAMCVGHAPLAPVTVAVSESTPGQLTVGAPVMFNTTGWELPQAVSVTAVDDATIEPPQQVILTHSVTSNDGSFNGKPVSAVTVDVADNDGQTDLVLAVTSNPGPIPVGTNFTVSFKVTNTGPTLSTGASFVVPAVAGFTFVGASGATCSPQAGVGLSCQLAGMGRGGSVSFSVTAQAVATGVWPVTMQVVAQQPDPAPGNNVVVKNLTVN
ncbi:MAG: DUF11 domain-containing protein [Gemmatimonadaceae bacterium]